MIEPKWSHFPIRSKNSEYQILEMNYAARSTRITQKIQLQEEGQGEVATEKISLLYCDSTFDEQGLSRELPSTGISYMIIILCSLLAVSEKDGYHTYAYGIALLSKISDCYSWIE